ncbi:MAG: tetratricopeptide repeat protein [Gammaproteobacteria bacterium]
MKLTLNPIAVLLSSITLAIIGFYAIAVMYYPNTYIICTYEDLYGEWAQTYGFFTTFVFSVLISVNKNHPQRWFFVLLAIASFYVFMEEISWGQRLIGFDTPTFFHKNSYQDEANIHNLLTGPVDSWTKELLTYFVAAGLVAYGVIFPIALLIEFKPAIWLSRRRIAAPPPLSLIPTFIAAAILEIEPFSFNEAEVAELLVAWALAFTALDSWLQNRNKQNSSVLPYAAVFIIAIGAAWGTTTLLLNSPEQRKEIDSRLANGYEKFVERYEGYDYTYGVAEVLQRYNDLKPNNTVILREIADNLEILGETEKAKVFIQKAVDEGLRRIKEDENNIQANVSLAKSYRKLGDYSTMTVYAEKAYQLAQAKQQAEPENAYWAYWLAKACEQTNRRQEAFQYYRKAHRLEPNSSRYNEAYQQMKEIMINYEN